MKAMVLAAGLGTRLEPLTKIRPKPLFPVLNQPLLEGVIRQLGKIGVRGIVINSHHLASHVVDFVRSRDWEGLTVEVRVEPEILGTAGGIKNCEDFFRDVPFFIVINADIYHTFDLRPALHYHKEANNLATMVLCDYPRFNQVGIDEEGRIVSVREKKIEKSFSPSKVLTFTGIHIISTELLASIPPAGYSDIIPIYIDLASRGKAVRGFTMEEGYWRDIGRIEDYRTLHQDIMGKRQVLIHPEARVEQDVMVEGMVCVGRGSSIGAGVHIRDSIIWEEVAVEGGSSIDGCIVGDGVRVQGEHRGATLIPGVI